MNVLSVFDGMSCGQIALGRAGITVDSYSASEIDKFAISIAQKNYPNTIQIGDVRSVTGASIIPPDLFIGGSPCQGFSFAGDQLNFEDPRSKLFFEFARLRDRFPNAKFLLENVRMSQKSRDVISGYLGVHPIECERLQTLPDNYTEGVSNTQRYKMIGNGWTADVIAHILQNMVL